MEGISSAITNITGAIHPYHPKDLKLDAYLEP